MWPSWQLIMLTVVVRSGACVEARLTVDNNDSDSDMNAYNRTFAPILSRLNGLELHVPGMGSFEHGFVQFLLQQRHCPLTLRRADAAVSEMRHQFWLFANVTEMHLGIGRLVNRGGLYILALEQAATDEALLQFMGQLWQRQGLNRVYYVLPGQRMLLYNPFRPGLVPLDDRPDAYERIYRNLHGYSLRAYIFDSVYSAVYGDAAANRVLRVTGADAKVAALLAAKLNFTLGYLWPDDEFFGGRLENGSFIGAIGRVHRKELDVVFAGFFVKDYLTRRLEFSTAVYMDELCLYVQRAKRIPQSILPLFAVRLDVWLCFLLVGFACAFLWLCIRGLNRLLHIQCIARSSGCRVGQSNCSIAWRIFIDTWVVWVRVNVGQFPPYHSERIFLASLCLVSVIFGALLESSLATVYIRPLYYHDVNTLVELDATRLPIYIKHPAFRDDLFVGQDSPVYQRLHAKMLLVSEGEDRLISMAANRGGFAGVTRAGSLALSDIRYIMTNRVHMIPECPKNYHIAYLLQEHSPYLDAINAVLTHISAAGLIDLWTGEMRERAKWSIHNFPDYLAALGAGRGAKVLQLVDVQLAFYALVLGCLLAAFGLLAELSWRRAFK